MGVRGRGVQFTFDTLEEKEAYEKYARKKGMTLSAFAKFALYQYRAKYPLKHDDDVQIHKIESDSALE